MEGWNVLEDRRGRLPLAEPHGWRHRSEVRYGEPEVIELANLSDRECDILALVAEGLTNRQIGEQLYLAENTANNHVSGLLAELVRERRTQAAVLAGRLLS